MTHRSNRWHHPIYHPPEADADAAEGSKQPDQDAALAAMVALPLYLSLLPLRLSALGLAAAARMMAVPPSGSSTQS